MPTSTKSRKSQWVKGKQKTVFKGMYQVTKSGRRLELANDTGKKVFHFSSHEQAKKSGWARI